MTAVRKEEFYTYEDWKEYDSHDGRHPELIDGQLYMMATPTVRHQSILSEVLAQLSSHLREKRCKSYCGLGIRLKKDTVVIPDLVLICDPSKMTKNSYDGAPDLVIEALSPSTARHDKLTKFMLYQRAGVPEYWIIDPIDNILTIHRLIDGKYTTSVHSESDTATVSALPDFELDLSTVFIPEEGE